MKTSELIKKYSKNLEKITNTPSKEIEKILCYVLKIDLIYLHLNYNKDLFLNKFKYFEVFKTLVKKRETSYPLEYILKKVDFYGLDFRICEEVLIPRPETELLIKTCLDVISENKINYNDENKHKKIKVLELGVGSGIISICLAKFIEDIEIKAIDISDNALKLAKENALFHKVENKIKFIESDLFENIFKEEKFDICISNPPYIANSYRLPDCVKFEPDTALFGGDIGDEFLKKIINETYKRKIKFLLCEIGYNQKKSLSKFLDSLEQNNYKFYRDYSGFDRGFTLEFL